MPSATQLSYSHGTSSVPLLGETIGDNLRRTVLRFADRDALVVRSQGYRATYRQLWDATSELALGLLAEGVSPGDRVGATLAKCEDYHAWGVPYCWVIDPEKRTAWQYHSGGEPEHISGAGPITAGQLSVRLEELFSQLPR